MERWTVAHDLQLIFRRFRGQFIVISLIIMVLSAGWAYWHIIQQQNAPSASRQIEAGESANLYIVYESALAPLSESRVDVRLIPNQVPIQPYTVTIQLIELNPEYTQVQASFSKTYLIDESSTERADSIPFILRNPPHDIDQVGFDVRVTVAVTEVSSIPVSIAISRLSLALPTISAISGLLLFVLTTIGERLFNTLLDRVS